MKKKALLIIGGLLGLLVALLLLNERAGAPSQTTMPDQTEQSDVQPINEDDTTKVFDKQMHSTTDPASPWVIVNKISALPQSYSPADLTASNIGGQLRAEAAAALNQLVTAATADGITLRMISSFRSYNTQVATYNRYVTQDGQAQADTYSARPGRSEHQTGWAADLGGSSCDLETCFGSTPEGVWLTEHAHEYGFTVRYPAGKEAITGYQYEPWHIRYVGVDLAVQLHALGSTMEESFNVVPQQQPY